MGQVIGNAAKCKSYFKKNCEKLYPFFFRSAPDAAPPAAAPGAPGAPGADGAPAGPPAPPNTSSNRRLQQTQAQVEEVSKTKISGHFYQPKTEMREMQFI